MWTTFWLFILHFPLTNWLKKWSKTLKIYLIFHLNHLTNFAFHHFGSHNQEVSYQFSSFSFLVHIFLCLCPTCTIRMLVVSILANPDTMHVMFSLLSEVYVVCRVYNCVCFSLVSIMERITDAHRIRQGRVTSAAFVCQERQAKRCSQIEHRHKDKKKRCNLRCRHHHYHVFYNFLKAPKKCQCCLCLVIMWRFIYRTFWHNWSRYAGTFW